MHGAHPLLSLHIPLVDNLVARQRCGALKADVSDQRIGVTVDERPGVPVAAIDLRDAKRPVLIWKIADFAALPFDHHEHDHVACGVGLFDFDRADAIAEALRHLVETLFAAVEAMARWAAERLHQCEILRDWGHEFVPAAHVAADESTVGVVGAAYEGGGVVWLGVDTTEQRQGAADNEREAADWSLTGHLGLWVGGGRQVAFPFC